MRRFRLWLVGAAFVAACSGASEEGDTQWMEEFRPATAADLVHKSFRFGSDAGIFDPDDPRFGQSASLIVGEVNVAAAAFALTTDDDSLQGGTLSLGSCLFQTTFVGLAGTTPEIGLLDADFFYCGVDAEGRLGLLDEDEENLIVSEVPRTPDPDYSSSASLSTESVVEPQFDPAARPERGSADLTLYGNVLSFTATIDELSPGDELRDGRIYEGAAGENGELLLTLFGSPIQPVRQVSPPFIDGTSITASIFLTPEEVTALMGDAVYLQVTSVQAPGGLVRGQLDPGPTGALAPRPEPLGGLGD